MDSLKSLLPVSRKTFESQLSASRLQFETQLSARDQELTQYREKVVKLEKVRQRLATRAFVGTQINRLTQDFTTSWASIDQDIRQGGPTLIARARHLVQNNAIAQRFIQLYITNVIGWNGHTFQPNVSEQIVKKVKGKDKVVSVPDVLANAKILEAWMDWTMPGNCTADGRHSFAGVSKLMGRCKARDGECFIRLVLFPEDKHPLKIQIIPVEAIDFELNGRLTNGNVIIMGVELDQWRRPVAYHVRKINPEHEVFGFTSYTGKSERIPAAEIIHWFDQEYYNQTRGITKFAQVMLDLHNFDRYENAVLVNATASASKMGFFGSTAGEEEDELTGDSTDEEGNLIIEADAGTFQDIGNRKFYPWDPLFPTQQHEMYVRAMSRKLAGGFGLAYSSLSNDYSAANYSSLRAELLVERENWKTEQQSFIDNVLRKIFARWIEIEILSGNIKLPFFKLEKFNKPVFVGPRWPWVDPVKDVQAKRLEIESGFDSPFGVVAEKGESSLQQIYQDLEEANELAAQHKLQLNFGSTPKQPADDEKSNDKKPPGENDEDEDEEKSETKKEERTEVDIAGALAGTNGNGHH